jgi:methionyl-tRNA synthetase
MTAFSKRKTLITTAIDYTNDVVHVGHAYQKILSDCIARYQRQIKGKENVFFLTGTDEYGSTNEKAAAARDLTPLEHVTDISNKDREQMEALGVSFDRFIRTTDPDHKKFAQEVFQKSFDNGDIYKENYQGFYCEGCESYKTSSELNEEGQCILHPTRQIQVVNEENYFFRWSKYSEFLKNLINTTDFVRPENRKKEMLAFLEHGLEDIPVSRPRYKVGWGIELPNDPQHVMYVWFDALVNYYTAGVQNGFWDEDTFIVHILGKDNIRFHALLWPAMLKSAGIRLPDMVYSHGFINLNGEKISKSRGNIIRPSELVEKYGVDAVRYYSLKHGPIVEDVNISLEHLEEVYNADLANGLGNTVARIAKLAENSGLQFDLDVDYAFPQEMVEHFNNFRVDLAIQYVLGVLSDLDKHINENKPWTITNSNVLQEVLSYEIGIIKKAAVWLTPIIPQKCQEIQKQFASTKIKALAPLFPRI